MRLPVCLASPSAMSRAVNVLPPPAGPKQASFKAAFSGVGLVKADILHLGNVGLARKLAPRRSGCPWVGHCALVRANCPRSVFSKRDSLPFTLISRRIAEYRVAAGVLPP